MKSKEEPNSEGLQNNRPMENSDGGTTVALQKKRARRVSFAELTSVHFFDRDEDNDTPPPDAESFGDLSVSPLVFGEHLGHQRELESEGCCNNDDEEIERGTEIRTFLRPVGSPSPGGSTYGSASSNDEDNFFGPVSASFIRPGRLSDSAASENHNEVTMDSTTFSMHFHSLARSDAGVGLKTPTEGQLLYDEKTPTDGNGSFMNITVGKKLIDSSFHATKIIASSDSNDMSLVGRTTNNYDYDLSPGLDAILAEGDEFLSIVAVNDDFHASKSPRISDSDNLQPTDHEDGLVNEVASASFSELHKANVPAVNFLTGHSPLKFSSSTFGAVPHVGDNMVDRSPHQLSETGSEKTLVDAASSPIKQQLNLLPAGSQPGQLTMTTPLLEQSDSFLRIECTEHHERESSIQKSISKLGLLEKSPFSSAFRRKVDLSTIRSLDFQRSPNFDAFSDTSRHVSKINLMEDSVTKQMLVGLHPSIDMRSDADMDINRIETQNYGTVENHLEESSSCISNGTLANVNSLHTDQLGDSVFPFKVTWSGNLKNGDSSTAPRGDVLMTERNCVIAEKVTVDGGKEIGSPCMSIPSPGRMFSNRIAVSPDRQFIPRNLEETKSQNELVNIPLASCLRKELDNGQSSYVPSPGSSQIISTLEKVPVKKRNLEVMLQDTEHNTELSISQRSCKIQKGGVCDPMSQVHFTGDTDGTAVPCHERKQWIDIYSKFSEDTQQVILRSADELNNKMIDMLGDKLVHRQRSKRYELLCSAIQNTAVLHDLQLEKQAEANSLLHEIAFEKAKLQLKHVKREGLLKKSHLLLSMIDDAKIVKTNMSSLPLNTESTSALADGVGDQPVVKLKKGNEAGHEQVTAIKQSLEDLDGEILNLKKSLHTACNIKAEPSLDTIAVVNEHLLKMVRCRSVRLDMQLWKIRSVNKMSGQHSVVLDYLSFVYQSINVTIGPTPSATTSFELNEARIIKRFPNMDTCSAFTFVFNASTCKFAFEKTLAQQTQVTSSLLGNLLDIAEEVQCAQVELHNLTEATFCSPSVGKLDLRLTFFNFNSARKVVLTLDMSCLKHGIYPSEVVPIQLSSESIPGEVRDSVKGVKTGFMRIQRLCRAVSQVLQGTSP